MLFVSFGPLHPEACQRSLEAFPFERVLGLSLLLSSQARSVALSARTTGGERGGVGAMLLRDELPKLQGLLRSVNRGSSNKSIRSMNPEVGLQKEFKLRGHPLK